MHNLPPCERCGANSYEGSMDERPIKCPFCKKPKRRGSREEIVAALDKSKHALVMSAGFIMGASAPHMTKELAVKWIKETIELINDV